MFKNMKHLITLALPVVALTFTSCGNGPKTITYEQMRRFATETYDEHALDTIPATYVANLNKMQMDVVVNYTTPEGGSDSFNIAFGFNDIHISFKDRYAVVLSSTLIDSIEQYYSDFVGMAVSLKQEPPIQMLYQLLGNNCSKIDFVANEKIVGSVLVKLLQFLGGSLDLASSLSGFIPNPEDVVDPEVEFKDKPIVLAIYETVLSLAKSLGKISFISEYAEYIPTVIFTMMDYASFSISDSSRTSGETFNTYLTTDSNGILDTFDFNFKSSFDLSGLVRYKQYDTKKPQPGDFPEQSRPYHLSISGSFDFDFDISSEIAY